MMYLDECLGQFSCGAGVVGAKHGWMILPKLAFPLASYKDSLGCIGIVASFRLIRTSQERSVLLTKL